MPPRRVVTTEQTSGGCSHAKLVFGGVGFLLSRVLLPLFKLGALQMKGAESFHRDKFSPLSPFVLHQREQHEQTCLEIDRRVPDDGVRKTRASYRTCICFIWVFGIDFTHVSIFTL